MAWRVRYFEIQNLLFRHLFLWGFRLVNSSDLLKGGDKEWMKEWLTNFYKGESRDDKSLMTEKVFYFSEQCSSIEPKDPEFSLSLKARRLSFSKDDVYFELEDLLFSHELFIRKLELHSHLSLVLRHKDKKMQDDISDFLKNVVGIKEIKWESVSEFAELEEGNGFCFEWRSKELGTIAYGFHLNRENLRQSEFYLDVVKLSDLMSMFEADVDFFGYLPKDYVTLATIPKVFLFVRNLFEDIGSEEYKSINFLRHLEGICVFIVSGLSNQEMNNHLSSSYARGLKDRVVMICYHVNGKTWKISPTPYHLLSRVIESTPYGRRSSGFCISSCSDEGDDFTKWQDLDISDFEEASSAINKAFEPIKVHKSLLFNGSR